MGKKFRLTFSDSTAFMFFVSPSTVTHKVFLFSLAFKFCFLLFKIFYSTQLDLKINSNEIKYQSCNIYNEPLKSVEESNI